MTGSERCDLIVVAVVFLIVVYGLCWLFFSGLGAIRRQREQTFADLAAWEAELRDEGRAA